MIEERKETLQAEFVRVLAGYRGLILGSFDNIQKEKNNIELVEKKICQLFHLASRELRLKMCADVLSILGRPSSNGGCDADSKMRLNLLLQEAAFNLHDKLVEVIDC